MQFDVLIAGAGIAGSALALALSGRGLRIGLLEAQPLARGELPTALEPGAFDPRVSALTPRSRSLLEGLGAWDAIAGYRFCGYRHMTVWDAEGTGRIEFDRSEVGAPELGYIVENRAITRALQERLDRTPDVILRNPARLENCRVDDDGAVHIQLAGGEQIDSDLLVAADGALSRVRQLLEFPTREWDYGHRAIVATVEVSQPHEGTAWQRFLPTGPLAFLPLPGADGRHFCSIVWSVEPELAQALEPLPEEQFCERLGDALEYQLGPVLAASSRSAFPLRQRHAVDYVRPGVALVADAAHTIHPLAGQGINLGLQDVAVLAEEVLAARERGLPPGELPVLRRYQRRRKGENLLMMAAMDGFKRLFEQQALPLRWLRNTGLRGVDALGPVKRELMRHAMGLAPRGRQR